MDTLKKRFIISLKENLLNVSSTCKALNVGRSTYYNWLKNDSCFKEDVDNIKEDVIDLVEQSLFKQIQEGNTTAIIFFLKTRGKSRGYDEKTSVQNLSRMQPPNITFTVRKDYDE